MLLEFQAVQQKSEEQRLNSSQTLLSDRLIHPCRRQPRRITFEPLCSQIGYAWPQSPVILEEVTYWSIKAG